ncbi:hypothetical protein WJX73_007272 [Symbiochloris irregularis]|uniref:DNA polymerase delta catalytic subunit n=1 Tax=Symbiochloris irregularis TaxID=706552 RepID=A0AAW1P793_9CHLO
MTRSARKQPDSKIDWPARKAQDIKGQAAGRGGVSARGLTQGAKSSEQPQALGVMTLDISEQGDGSFQVWGTSEAGQSVLLRIDDFQPYLYISAPRREGTDDVDDDGDLDGLLVGIKQHMNRRLPSDSRIDAVTLVDKIPLMYYRPGKAHASSHLKLSFQRGANMRKAAGIVQKAALSACSRPWLWTDTSLHEHEVSLLQRFLTDTSLSGGAWMCVTLQSAEAGGKSPDTCGQLVQGGQRLSSCAVEAIMPWQCLHSLTPDATQLADEAWTPQEPPAVASNPAMHACWTQTAAQAKAGDIAPLRLMALDVVMASADGQDRVPVPAKDPIVAIACIMFGSKDATLPGMGTAAQQGDEEDAQEDPDGSGPDEEQGALGNEAVLPALPTMSASSTEKVVFTWHPGGTEDVQRELSTGALVRSYSSEADMLTAWRDFFDEADPDAIPLFQVRDTLGALSERWKALGLSGTQSCRLSRHAGQRRRPITVRRITMYSADWVKRQTRMASTSNQETFRAEVEGRLVFDILRQAITSCNLASFSLVDCMQTLLGRTLEVLPPDVLAGLAGLAKNELATGSQQERALRLARYTLARGDAVCSLVRRLATIPETLELGRATGLTCNQVMYNAQMVRTLSLLLRNARRMGYIIGGRQDATQLQESPFLIHPVETGAVRLYQEPLVILDFASLYPSLFRSYNLCYTTLLHPDDVKDVDEDSIITSPTGAKFVKSGLRSGVLPSILAALMSARNTARASLKQLDGGSDADAQRAVLDSRQKALKLAANALYGFTGAVVSPLQCVQLADSCLALGAASCRRAKEILEDLAASGRLGPSAKGAKVVYAQTDSLFAHLPHASPLEALQIGAQAAKLVSAAFPEQMELKFEKMCMPFMLLHVNRYAGRAFETAGQVEEGKGTLMIKGLKSAWRQAAPIVRSTIQGALTRILMQGDTAAAVAFVADEVRRLLSGGCRTSEFIMTGGLWRLTGSQVAAAAAEEAPAAAGAAPSAKAGAAKGKEDPEVRGPHAALAVRLQKRDPGRTFVLGERLLYVLLAGERLQDDAAEDPLTAALQGAPANAALYWKQKMMVPLSEVFAVCLSSPALQSLLNGPHTLVHSDLAEGSATSPMSSPARKGGRSGAAQQTRLGSFFKSMLRCLNCKRSIPYNGPPPGPGLCSDCQALEGVQPSLHASFTQQQKVLGERRLQALSNCYHCHSGGLSGALGCANGECDNMYIRLDTTARLSTVTTSLARLDW